MGSQLVAIADKLAVLQVDVGTGFQRVAFLRGVCVVHITLHVDVAIRSSQSVVAALHSTGVDILTSSQRVVRAEDTSVGILTTVCSPDAATGSQRVAITLVIGILAQAFYSDVVISDKRVHIADYG